MGFLDLKDKVFTNQADSPAAQNVSPVILQAEQSLRNAANDTKNAVFELGMQYYEANKDNADAAFSSQIERIKECTGKEALWELYRLELDGKTKCDSCGAIITSDSAFCNKCGKPITQRDYSGIGINKPNENGTAAASGTCPSCGAPLADDAMFCEKCGTKVR